MCLMLYNMQNMLKQSMPVPHGEWSLWVRLIGFKAPCTYINMLASLITTRQAILCGTRIIWANWNKSKAKTSKGDWHKGQMNVKYVDFCQKAVQGYILPHSLQLEPGCPLWLDHWHKQVSLCISTAMPRHLWRNLNSVSSASRTSSTGLSQTYAIVLCHQ